MSPRIKSGLSSTTYSLKLSTSKLNQVSNINRGIYKLSWNQSTLILEK